MHRLANVVLLSKRGKGNRNFKIQLSSINFKQIITPPPSPAREFLTSPPSPSTPATCSKFQSCEPGHVFWPADSTCYRQHIRGPCQHGELIHLHPNTGKVSLYCSFGYFCLFTSRGKRGRGNVVVSFFSTYFSKKGGRGLFSF